MGPAEFFGVVLCRFTGKVRRIFNPNEDWEFAAHQVDPAVEMLLLESKDDWGVPREPNAMTLAMVSRIQTYFENSRRNWRPGDDRGGM